MHTDSEQSKDTDKLNDELAGTNGGYREYSYRYVIMALFYGVSMTNQLLWVTCSPITTNLQKIYGLDQLTINLSSLVFLMVYVPVSIPGNYLLDTYGTRIGLMVGAGLTLIGAWVRLLADNSFYFVLAGQLFAAIGQPLIVTSPQKISAYWNLPQKRTIFTTLLTLAAPIGVAIGFVLPGAIVGEEESPTEGKDLFMRLLLVEGVISTVLCVPLFIFFREKPPTPPSPSAELPRDNFKTGMKTLFKKRGFLALLIVEAVGLGTFNSLATIVQSFIDPFGYTQVDASVLGAIIIVSGLVGSIVMGLFVEKTRKYRKALIICVLSALFAFGFFIGAMFVQNIIVLAIVTTFLGFFMTPILPLGLEFACEITFPIGEAVTGGTMIGMSQLVGAIQIVIINAIMSMDDRKLGTVITAGMYISLLVVAFIASLSAHENLLRSKHDRGSKDNSVHSAENLVDTE